MVHYSAVSLNSAGAYLSLIVCGYFSPPPKVIGNRLCYVGGAGYYKAKLLGQPCLTPPISKKKVCAGHN